MKFINFNTLDYLLDICKVIHTIQLEINWQILNQSFVIVCYDSVKVSAITLFHTLELLKTKHVK